MPDPPESVDLATVGTPWSAQSEDLRSRLIELEAGASLPGHVNREVDLVLVGVSGRGRVRLEATELELGPGQALQVPKGTSRELRAGEEGPWRVLVVHRRTAVSSSWRWRPRRRRPWEDDPWADEENG